MAYTNCECTEAGWCPRHDCYKPKLFFLMCQSRDDMFARWEQGCGPGQGHPTEPRRPYRYEPCRHRGLEPIEHVENQLCGGRHRPVPVYPCALFGKCTYQRWTKHEEQARTMPVCLCCNDYSPEEADRLEGSAPALETGNGTD